MRFEAEQSQLSRFAPLVLAAGFFVLYLATCQRGWCWQDGGLFQRRIFSGDIEGSFGIAAAHPTFIWLGCAVDSVCRMLGGGMVARLFLTNAQSAFWMAVAVGFFAAAVRRYSGSGKASLICSFMLGFAHMTWWMGTICEAHALELALFAVELYIFVGLAKESRFSMRPGNAGLACLAFASGLHFSVHNLALLALPVYAFVAWRMVRGRHLVAKLAGIAGIWAIGASPVLYLAVREIPRSGLLAAVRSVLVGSFGSEVVGILPSSPKIFLLNCALAALSFAVPFAGLGVVKRPRGSTPAIAELRVPLVVMLAIHAVFLVRYFVPDQAFFLLPTLALWILLMSPGFAAERHPVRKLLQIAACGVLLPALASFIAPRGLDRGTHPGRDDAKYFAIPWKFNEDSCDRLVKERGLEDVWAGYLPAADAH